MNRNRDPSFAALHQAKQHRQFNLQIVEGAFSQPGIDSGNEHDRNDQRHRRHSYLRDNGFDDDGRKTGQSQQPDQS